MEPKIGDKLRVTNENKNKIPMFTQVLFEGDYDEDDYLVHYNGECVLIEKDSVCLVEDEPEMVFEENDYALVLNNKYSEHKFPIGSLVCIAEVLDHTEHGRRLIALNQNEKPEKQVVYWSNIRKLKPGEKIRIKGDETKIEYTLNGKGNTRKQTPHSVEREFVCHISEVIFIEDEFVNIHDDEQDEWGDGWD